MGVRAMERGCWCPSFSPAGSSQRGHVGECWGEWPVDVRAGLLGWVVMLSKAPTVRMHPSAVPRGFYILYYLHLASPSP